MSLHQEAAYRRLYRWVRDEARSLENDVTEPTYDPLMSAALNALRERPVLLGYFYYYFIFIIFITLLRNCLDEIGNYRCKAIVKGFINALTIGGPNGMPRPIELNAHDPIRCYISLCVSFLMPLLPYYCNTHM